MLSYILYRIGQFIALSLPVKFGYFVATFFSDIHHLFANKDRKAVAENLKAIFPEKSGKEIRAIRLRMSRNFAKYLVDFFRFDNLDREYINKHIHVENIENFNRAMDKGKGVVVLTAHLGNWELGGVVIALMGYPFWVVALPHKDKLVNKFFNDKRESKGIKVMALGSAVRTCLKVLNNNQLIGLVGDRDFTDSGLVMDFFGKPTIFPEGPAAFCLKTGAPIVPGFMLRNKDDSFTLLIEKPIEFQPTGDRHRDLRELMQRYIKLFEDYIRRYPDQWYMFRRFWADENMRPHPHLQ
jgi:lauroyl/myristoyl acyltransferase